METATGKEKKMEEERMLITRLPGDVLRPHPDNPRKDLGDLTELTDSIRANGIMQNLTVIPTKELPGGDPESERYTILIGHRRYAAGKAAGIKVFPCHIVRGLSHSEQVAIMLEENIQRNDLTLREQAEGMQMLLDLGESYQTITKKTGFSESTIRHRVNLLKLDPDLFEERQHQLTLKDFAKLESIPAERRDEALKGATNSVSIQAAVDRIAEEEKRKRLKETARKWFTDRGLTEEPDMRTYGKDVVYISLSDDWKGKAEELAGDIEAFCIPEYSYQQTVYLRIAAEEEEEETEEDRIQPRISGENIRRVKLMDSITESEFKRLKERLIAFIKADECFKESDMVDMMTAYMNLPPFEEPSWGAPFHDIEMILNEVSDREEYEDEDMDAYFKLNISTRIMLCLAAWIDKPFGWQHERDEDSAKTYEICKEPLKRYVAFAFSPEMEALYNGSSPLYEIVTEETLETWDEEFR